jgi:DMSO reductase family type II enzyme chaperone
VSNETIHEPEITDTDREVAIGRAAVYAFLAHALLFPTAEAHASARLELLPLVRAVSSTAPTFDALLVDALVAYNIDLDELRRAHGRVFTHIENQDCPAHESAYCPGDVFRRADVMADVAAFYRAHGLQVGGTRRERVDHITTELEFLSFLARKEAYAIEHLGPDEIEECQRSQEHFLRDHVGRWAPGFADRLQTVADHQFFVTIGSLLAAWLEADLSSLAIEPGDEWTEPQPLPPPDDGMCGVDAADVGTPVNIRS